MLTAGMSITLRRGVLGEIAGLAMAGAPLGAHAAPGEDPHLGWAAEWQRLKDFWNSPATAHLDSDDSPFWDGMEELGELIFDTPATTDAGLEAQIGVVLCFMSADDPGRYLEGMAEVRVLRHGRAALAGRA